MKLPKSPKSLDKKIEKAEEFVPFPDLPKKDKSKKPKSPFLIIFFIFLLSLILFFLGLFIYSRYYSSQDLGIFTNTKQASKEPETPSKRAQIHEFNHEPINTQPQPYRVIIDPVDPKLGEDIKLTIYIKHDNPIISATAMLETDNNSLEQPLNLTNGDNMSGVWTTSWKLEDTYNNTFHFVMAISDLTETYEGVVAIK